MNIGLAVPAGRVKKEKGQDRKSHKRVIFYLLHIWTEPPNEAICIKNCVVNDVFDVTTCAKFQNEIFRGYNFTGGQIFIFLLISERALQQCSATVLPVILSLSRLNVFSSLPCEKKLAYFD